MKRTKLYKRIILGLLLSSGFIYAGESLFGISNKSLGTLQHPYTSSGQARSYEIAHQDSMQLNFNNYAAWSEIAYTIFTIKAGYGGALSDDNNRSLYNDNANFKGGMLGFPLIKQKLVFGIAILPYTFINQRIEEQFTLEDDTEIIQRLRINGGLSRTLLNFSYRPFSKLNVAIGYEYTFGKVTENLVKDITDYTTSRILINYDYRYSGNGIVFSVLGNPTENLRIGMVFRPSLNLDLKRGGDTASDELNNFVRSDLSLPAEWNMGLEYSLNKNYLAGIDYIYQNWKDGFKRDDLTDPTQEVFYRIGMGFERKPSERLFINLAEQMSYRMGIFYGQLNHTRENNSVSEYGLSMGISLPIQRFRSGIDLSAVFGKRGSISKNSLEETFISFDITINASELWFKNIER